MVLSDVFAILGSTDT